MTAKKEEPENKGGSEFLKKKTEAQGKQDQPAQMGAERRDFPWRAEAALPQELSGEEATRLIHELRAHQKELERQNEALRQTQVQLAESRWNYARLFDLAPVGYLTVDEQGLIVEANQMAARQLGLERDRLLNLAFPLLLVEGEQPTCRRLLADLAGERQVRGEFHLRDGAGKVRTLLLEMQSWRDFHGRELRQIAMTDISELKWTQEELGHHKEGLERLVAGRTAELIKVNEQLREANVRLETLFQATPLAVGVFDHQGRVVNINPASERIYGWPLAEIQGQVLPAIPEEETEHLRQLLQEVLQGKSLVGVELRHRRRDGSRFQASMSTAPLRDPQGNIQGFVALAEDISERKQREEILKTQTQVLANMAEGVTVTDNRGIILYTNAAFDAMFGYKPGELIGRHSNILNYYPPEENARVVKDILKSVQHTGVWSGEFRNCKKHGQPFFTASHISMLRVGGKKLFISVQEDITGRKRAEKEIRRLASFPELDPYPVLEVDGKGAIVYANPAARKAAAKLGGEAGLRAFLPADLKEKFASVQHGGSRQYSFEKDFGEVVYALTLHLPHDLPTARLYAMDITLRKQAEKALQKSEERLLLAQQVAKVGAFEWDMQTGVNTWTPELERIYGIKEGGFAGTQAALERLIHPDDRAAAGRLVEQAFNTGEPTEGEWRVIWPDGSVRWISGRWQVIKNESGQPLRVIGINLDLTERKQLEVALHQAHEMLEQEVADRTEQLRHTVNKLLQEIAERERAEARLRESETRFAAFMKHLPGSAIMRDREGRFVFVNEAWEKALGRRPGESLGKTAADFWERGLAERLQALDQEVFSQNRPVEAMMELPVGGRLRTFLSHRFPIRNDAGQVEMVGSIGIDITDRLKAEETRDRLIEILEATPDFVATAERDGRLFYLNRAARKMLGLEDREDFSDLTYAETMPPWAVERVLTEGQPVYAREGVWQGESAILCGDGSEVPVSQVILVHRDPEGRVKFFSTICRDISEIKRAEEKLRRSEDKLRFLAGQLLTVQEDERQRLATELHEELGHALLTLKLHLSGVEQQLLPEQGDLKEKIAYMEHYLTDTVEELRRLYYTLSPGDLEDLGLTAALGNMVEDFQEFYPDIDWKIELADIDRKFSLHIQTMIYRTVQEALTNIGKHAYPKNVKVKVTQEDRQAVFVIQDDGRGFSPDEVQEGDKRGMGLAAMAQRVRLAGGIFDVWSREQQGARITFRIPINPAGENV